MLCNIEIVFHHVINERKEPAVNRSSSTLFYSVLTFTSRTGGNRRDAKKIVALYPFEQLSFHIQSVRLQFEINLVESHRNLTFRLLPY